MKELGMKTYRFSISWARIIPDGEGEINQKGLDFYNKIIDKLIECDIEPFVTLYHFDLPFKLVENIMVGKVEKLSMLLKDLLKYALSILEIG